MSAVIDKDYSNPCRSVGENLTRMPAKMLSATICIPVPAYYPSLHGQLTSVVMNGALKRMSENVDSGDRTDLEMMQNSDNEVQRLSLRKRRPTRLDGQLVMVDRHRDSAIERFIMRTSSCALLERIGCGL